MVINVYGDVHFHRDETDSHITTIQVNAAKKKVKSRDGCCICCGEVDKQLQVHHIFPKSSYPNLSADENNMICLCQSCHDKYHRMYNLKECNPVSFAKFLKDYGKRIYGGK